MRLILYLYFVCFLSPYMFRALTGPSSGCPYLLLCYHLVLAVLLTDRASVEVALSYGKATSMDARTVKNTARTKW
jgi:uncharacterized membrane protein YozB (DUF420 family)